MQDRLEARARGGVLEGERAHGRAVERAVGADEAPRRRPRAARSIAAPAGRGEPREISSVSTIVAPSAARRAATVDLPEPMPPVSPTTELHAGKCPSQAMTASRPQSRPAMPPSAR